jgi:hypothetical protein
MKKFKLIKEYPGSPNLGTICEERNNKSSFCYYFEGEKNIGITKDQVENQPEYWEEVIKKDYEILISRVVPQEILSVKRLSDGEVFTVGDKITGYSYKDARSIQTIKICSYTGIIKLEQDKGFTELHSATKAKNPIFLTHDRKDIFAEDIVWYVNKENFYYDYIKAYPEVKFNSEIRAYFLTREAAEDYIEKNKFLFITEDGVGIKQGDMIHGIYKAGNIFAISSTVVRNDNRICEVFEAIFSTIAAAENYLVQKSHSLSIEDFWEFVSWGGSNFAKSKRLKRLVKERLNIE